MSAILEFYWNSLV